MTIINPYDPRANASTFDMDGYLIKLAEQLQPLRAELPQGIHPLDVPEVRRKLTERDPFLAALLAGRDPWT